MNRLTSRVNEIMMEADMNAAKKKPAKRRVRREGKKTTQRLVFMNKSRSGKVCAIKTKFSTKKKKPRLQPRRFN